MYWKIKYSSMVNERSKSFLIIANASISPHYSLIVTLTSRLYITFISLQNWLPEDDILLSNYTAWKVSIDNQNKIIK